MYQVKNWDTKQTIVELELLPTAKKVARHQGHTGQHNGKFYAPVAYVSDGEVCVYNPRFKVGKDDNFKPTPFAVTPESGPRKCSHGNIRGCLYGCN